MADLSLSTAWNQIHSSKLKAITFYFVAAIGVVQILELLDITTRSEKIDASYAKIMEEVYLSGGTTAQIEARKEQYLGKSVNWRGVVVDASKQGWGGYTVSVGDTSAAFTDVYLHNVPESEALSLSPREKIRYSGTIKKFRDGTLTGYVYLENVSLK